MKVYYLSPGATEPIVVSDLLKKPNGIIGTPNGKYFYVADIEGNKTYQFIRALYGTLTNPKALLNQGSDGMTVDGKGNLYLTGEGVTIPEKWGKLMKNLVY